MTSRSVTLLLVQQQKSHHDLKHRTFHTSCFFVCPNITFKHHLLTLEPLVNCIGHPEPVSVELVEDIMNHGLIIWIVV